MFSSSYPRRLLVGMVTVLILILPVQPRAWASPAAGRVAQTIPTVTPASQPGAQVALPNGLDQGNPLSAAGQGDRFWLSLIPIGCILFVAALVLVLLGLFVWLRQRRRSKT